MTNAVRKRELPLLQSVVERFDAHGRPGDPEGSALTTQDAAAPNNSRVARCRKCGARMSEPAPEVFLTLDEIMRRYGVGRTKALELRREVRKRFPEAVRSHRRCVRVEASALDRVWGRG